jgi:uncharacterized protein YjbI with pentapeptide repeats
VNQNLANAKFDQATLVDTDFTGALIRGASFAAIAFNNGFTANQLYSTASYQEGDLSGINLAGNELSDWNFAGINLTNANLVATLSGANLTGAVIRGADLSGTTSRGFTAAQLESTTSYMTRDLTGIGLSYNNLSSWDFANQNLTDSDFQSANLTGANFAGANLTNANFGQATVTGASFAGAEVRGAFFPDGITIEQLYSTASYQNGDLTGIRFDIANLPDANFAGKILRNAVFYWVNLSGANLSHADLSNAVFDVLADLSGANLRHAILMDVFWFGADANGADLSGADLRGGGTIVLGTNLRAHLISSGAITSNTIFGNGHIYGLDLTSGQFLTVRDYNGAIPIVIQQHVTTDSTSTLRLSINGDAWDSIISFAPGIPVALGGTLELNFASGVDLHSQMGRTIRLFDWTSVSPTGQFNVVSPHSWNLSRLYTTGEVTLIPEPTAGTLMTFSVMAFGVAARFRRAVPFRRGQRGVESRSYAAR